MIYSTVTCFFTLISIFGYSYWYKKIINKESCFIITNQDFFYGIILIIFFSLLLNFFFPLKYFSIFIIILGLILFFIASKKNIYQIKLKYYLIFIFFINFFSFYNGPNVDSPMYHLQTINWMYLNKINLGIPNLEMRFGHNSSWHLFLAMTNITLGNFSTKYYLSSIIFSIVCYEIVDKKKQLFLSDIYLYLSISFLILFSLIHPNVNGPILNQLGNPESDTVAMFLYIFILYLFLKIYEKNFEEKKILISLLILLIFLSISVKISNIGLFFLLVVIILNNKKYKLIIPSNIFIFFTSILWFLRNFFTSGCLIYPIKFTCFNVVWANIEQTEFHANQDQSFARDTRLRERYGDFDYTLNSNEWFFPWFNDYFLNTAILKIAGILFILGILLNICLLVYNYILNKKFNVEYKFLFILIFFFICAYIWLRAPEVRFGSGFIISLSCFFISIIIYKLFSKNYLNYKNIKISIFVSLFLLSFKHYNLFEVINLFQNNRNYSYSAKIYKLGSFEGAEIYHSLNSQCGDFPKICVNQKKSFYKIINKFNYRIFLKNER